MPGRHHSEKKPASFEKFRMGDYLVERLLGKGGMGLVFLAKEISLDRWVALKLLGRAFRANKQAGARFLTEARAIARLDHRNIVRVHNVGKDPESGRIFMSMEFVKGQTLSARMRQDDMSFGEILRICKSVASGLQHAWAARVVHRDIKPGNIMLAEDSGRVKILDFGLARFREKEGHGSSGTVMGTPSYMSPEQSEAGSVDCRSDLYALGVILYEMLAGSRPFTGDFPASLIYLHCYANPRRISSVRKNVPPGFEDILERLLAKKPEQRYRDPAALLHALEALELKLGRARLLDDLPLGPIVKPTMTVEVDSYDPKEMLNTKRGVTVPGRRWPIRLLLAALIGLAVLAGLAWTLGSWTDPGSIGPDTPVQWSQALPPWPSGSRLQGSEGSHWEHPADAAIPGSLWGRGSGRLEVPLDGPAWRLSGYFLVGSAPRFGVFLALAGQPQLGMSLQRYSRDLVLSIEEAIERDGVVRQARFASQEVAFHAERMAFDVTLLGDEVRFRIDGRSVGTAKLTRTPDAFWLMVEGSDEERAGFLEVRLRQGVAVEP